ncbi:transposase-like protein [Novosphingobium sp. SG751A]|nr:transposase-like protein [Novosphingobium sp. SG751A]
MKTSSAIEPVILRQNKYKNNIIEQEHRHVKRRIRPTQGFKAFFECFELFKGRRMHSRNQRYTIKSRPPVRHSRPA